MPVIFGAFTFDPASQELRKSGTRVRVPGQSLAMLGMLLERPGELITRGPTRRCRSLASPSSSRRCSHTGSLTPPFPTKSSRRPPGAGAGYAGGRSDGVRAAWRLNWRPAGATDGRGTFRPTRIPLRPRRSRRRAAGGGRREGPRDGGLREARRGNLSRGLRASRRYRPARLRHGRGGCASASRQRTMRHPPDQPPRRPRMQRLRSAAHPHPRAWRSR